MPVPPGGVGWRGSTTSLAAAATVAPKAANIRDMVVALLKRASRPLTSEEIADALDMDYRSVQPRLSELKRAGRVVDSGTRRMSSRGIKIIAWEAA